MTGWHRLPGSKSLLDALEDNEEDRDDEEQGDGADEHAADDAYTQRMVAVGSYTRG